jgi:5-methyltetrahydropteroyltriglutamate--homocysteine methyltransferase
MVVGSLPRPQWVRDLIEDRKAGRASEEEVSTLLDDAIPSAIHMQERAGLDFVSDGEWRRESYLKVFSEAVDGFEADLIEDGMRTIASYPAVVSRLARRRPLAAAEAAFLRDHTNARIIVPLPSPYTIGRWLWSPEHSGSAYTTREEFMEACIPIVRQEIQELASQGVDAVQLDDPGLAALSDPAYIAKKGITDVEREVELSVKCVNDATAGIEGVNLSVHLCDSQFIRSNSTEGIYDLVMDALGRMSVDRFAIEFATADPDSIGVLQSFPSNKILGLGVIDRIDPRIETPEEVVARAEMAMQFIPKERITLNPDCGFAPSSRELVDLDMAYLKLRAMCEGARLLREKYG